MHQVLLPRLLLELLQGGGRGAGEGGSADDGREHLPMPF